MSSATAVPAPPSILGRGVIVMAGAPLPAPWIEAPVVSIDEAVLAAPAGAVERLHSAWAEREPIVVELSVDPAVFRAPESIAGDVWAHTPATEPWFDRLHFLVWANNYDARTGASVWWWATKGARTFGDGAVALDVDGHGDVRLADGTVVWIDGGPRQVWAEGELDLPVVHAESVEADRPTVTPARRAPTSDLAPDQLAAVTHERGPARIIAPAGSGKTRVLTERLRHLLADRGVERSGVLAVAYNKQAQLEMQSRTSDISPHVRTLNSLGLWVLTQHRGGSPPVVDEREVRRLVEAILPGRWRRRANTDPVAPYIEALSSIRLGLRDPAEVEASRDDVDGLSELFDPFRARLADRGAVDFDEQVYGAIETLLVDGEFRRAMQRSCRHLLVDEFQDLTPAHVLLLRLLALPALDVFGVGDDDQCIYGYAGADPGFLIGYRTLFPGAAEHALRVNYRCAAEVVTSAATLLDYNRRRVSKDIVAGPENDRTPGALQVVEHVADHTAAETERVVEEWLDEGVEPGQIALLARVNSVLLAPHVALHAAGIPLASMLTPDVLSRTGLRAALAYLRIASAPGGFAASDVVEILRRPTRGLPQWFPDRLSRRRTWTVGGIAGLATQMSDKDEAKVFDLADDLTAVINAAKGGTTRRVLEVVRDDVGLGQAMSLLDRSGSGQGSSHLDDLDGLLAVADLHPDPATFEPWLREVFQRESDAGGVTLSTIHRVKGREWDRVVVFGVSEGLLPHRLAEDIEEERRVLHVGITRGRHRVTVMTDSSRPSSFLGELDGSAPKRPALRVVRSAGPEPGRSRRAQPSETPVELEGDAAIAERALRAWRTQRAKDDGVPAYIVLNDKSLRAIAAAMPTTAKALVQCDGIGPAKLERYGDEILAIISASEGMS
ncbi:ATP-dependent helicase [Desertimonas flava]|uniref:ATP-dependent helicase n=1 Tax=Desertimonas flava TaxID=2064846 RepID=UPI0013C4ED34|nr:ATP-dependent DNA helicase UvrD2 [Desertimonas flava]